MTTIDILLLVGFGTAVTLIITGGAVQTLVRYGSRLGGWILASGCIVFCWVLLLTIFNKYAEAR